MLWAVEMYVLMPVRSVSYCANRTPNEVSEAEYHDEPGGNIAAESLNPLKSKYSNSQGHTNKAQYDGAQHVANTTQERNERGLHHAPAARLGERDEWYIMIRP
jgi:hypothetical protein